MSGENSDPVWMDWRWIIGLIYLVLWIVAYVLPICFYVLGGGTNYVYWYGWKIYDDPNVHYYWPEIIIGIFVWVIVVFQISSLYLRNDENPKLYSTLSFFGTVVLLLGFSYSWRKTRLHRYYNPSGFMIGTFLSIIAVVASIVLTILIRKISRHRQKKLEREEKDAWAKEAADRARAGEI